MHPEVKHREDRSQCAKARQNSFDSSVTVGRETRNECAKNKCAKSAEDDEESKDIKIKRHFMQMHARDLVSWQLTDAFKPK